ncbi:TonB-dependent siderophore receptor [Pseudomonas capsici]|uniref:TonB-dependent siderophore receptor n=1 Tax=Pseudomonas capsici TaxID=2810614 RepID=A0ABT3BZ31_9PSED|nr:TonB-dependent siderophore receptor [Pseudomonas capsici]MBX8476862.1 TonB-dependent siderophore receptor [Pseudomonas cichorii]MBN6715897.1 TonB-dependent siderophore receptor [Pseudomonas capsici]MBN6720851.1 TonB-dependent siderophore receptor [Pseudomonas capsici]MBN6725799.1 TonB-dependent siderophore receptor [Pseudomonas capsici]MCV4270411.1 TonB-dependent siderophore receptor [Pseudomonas capsici]
MLRPFIPTLTGVLALGLSASALAAPVSLNLPSQSLSSSLTQLSQVSGMQVNFDARSVAGKQAPAVRGNLEPAQALNQLLAGSGLGATVQGNSAQVFQQQAAGPVSLGNVDINADTSIAGAATTEGTNSYTTGSMNTATKLPLSIRETPQSVSVMTRQRMDDKGMSDVNDVVKYAPGVTLRKFGQDRQQFLARGFTIDNLMYDGLPSSLGTFTQDTISEADLAIYDRVEVVRGATGLMTGAGNPSATLNMVRKRPTATPQLSITTSAGSWDRYRTEVDASNKLNESGTLRGRAVAAYEDNKSFVDERNKQRQTFYGILEADLSDSTTWSIGASKQRDDATSDWGSLPSGPNGENLHLSRSTFLSNDWAYWDRDNVSLFTDLTHRFDNGWNAKLAAAKIWAESNSFSSYLNYGGSTGFTQSSGQYDTTDDQTNLDGSLSGPFQLFGREHELTIGASRREEKFDQVGGWWLNSPSVDIYNFSHSVIAKPSRADRNPYQNRYTATEEAFYAVARFNPIDPLHVIIGSRLSWYDYDDRSATGDYKVTQEVTPYAGVIYDLNDTYSVYASYTEIFKPQNNKDVSGSVLDPMTGKSYEIGLKGEYFDGALNASVALFDMTQEKRAYELADQQTSCPTFAANQTCYGSAGEVRSRGIDTEISGALTPNWQFSAAYTYVLSQYVKDAVERNEGRLFAPEQPKHLFKATTSYNLQGDLSKWRVGADVLAQSETFNRVGTGYATQNAYSVVGLMAGYKFDEHWDGRVNFNNVFDTKYWQGIPTGTGSGVYGDPRNLMFSLKWTL